MTPGIKKSFHNDKRTNSPGGYRIIHIYPPNESFKTVLARNDKIERGNRKTTITVKDFIISLTDRLIS